MGTGELTSVALSRNGEQLAVGCANGDVVLWTVGQDKQDAVLSGSKEPVKDLAFSRSGRMLAWLTARPSEFPNKQPLGSIFRWDAETAGVARTPTFSEGPGDWLTFSPDSRYLINATDQQLVVRDAETLDEVWQLASDWRRVRRLYDRGELLQVGTFGQLLAFRGKRFEIAALAEPSPSALSADSRFGYVPSPPRRDYWLGEGGPGVLKRGGGIEVVDLEFNRTVRFLRIQNQPLANVYLLQFIAPTPGGQEGWLVARVKLPNRTGEDIILINLQSLRYGSLLPRERGPVARESCIAVATASGPSVVVAGAWGVVVWRVD
jgi:hypothetical protein